MFESLHPLSHPNACAAADALEADGRVAVLVDPLGAYAMFLACTNHEVDFFLVDEEGKSLGISADDYTTIGKWMAETIPLLCRRWRARHPKSRQTSPPRVKVTEQ